MDSRKKSNRNFYQNESGVALVTVIMISVLLLIACVAILSAVGSHSRNVTDVLSESKAYYAAESGLQSTINVLRGNVSTPIEPLTGTADQDISYRRATTPEFSNLSTDPNTAANISRLSRWLPYNYPSTGTPDRVVIGSGTYNPLTGVAYKVEVIDPDETAESIVFSTAGGTDGATTSATVAIPSATATDRIEITFTNVVTTEEGTVLFATGDLQPKRISTFNVRKVGNGVTSGEARFNIVYRMTFPRSANVSIRGEAVIDSGNVVITFDSYIYSKVGSNITLCGETEASCASATGAEFNPTIAIPLADDGTQNTAAIWANITPVEPYRLVIRSTGYGPNGAIKKLEAVIQRNFFNDLASSAAVAMIGPTGSGFVFEPGNSHNVNYCGVEDSDPDEPCEMPPEGTPVNTVPSIGLTDPTNYQYVVDNPPQSGFTPPPAMINNEAPDWQQSTYALDELVSEHRQSAQPETYYEGTNPPYFGTYDAVNDRWNGVTFCEGNCDLTGDGGGILVVTGKLTLVGNFSFKGLIIVTGAGGVDRRGAGNGAIIGNLVIAPYDPNNLAGGFLPPKYDMRGGGISDIIFSGSSTSFDGQTAISDFMQGVSEK